MICSPSVSHTRRCDMERRYVTRIATSIQYTARRVIAPQSVDTAGKCGQPVARRSLSPAPRALHMRRAELEYAVNVLFSVLVALALAWALAYWSASALVWVAAIAAGLLAITLATDIGAPTATLLWVAFAVPACIFTVGALRRNLISRPLLGGQLGFWKRKELLPVRIAAEQLAVPPHGPGVERLLLGLRDLR